MAFENMILKNELANNLAAKPFKKINLTSNQPML